ncbi:MAG: metallophosphoesterase [Clostridia bacterium]|nr:metallophosphoesterase [Clostridia bacterium]
MTYVISDVHGDYEKYAAMLKKIAFSDDDTLYILGDVVDRGEHPMRILSDMSMRTNVIPIMGNHEHMAEHVLRAVNVEITEESLETNWNVELIRAVQEWYENGGYMTSKDFSRLSLEDREYILDYLEEFSFYEELTVGENTFVLVHGGLPDFSPEKPLDDYHPVHTLYARADYEKRYYPDKYLITGHTPTFLIDPAYDGRIYIRNGHIAIDCGVCHGKNLGCIRLDDMAEFYV